MKVLLVHLCLVAATVSGFTPSPSASSICRGATTTALGVAGGYHRNSNGQKKPAAAAQDDEDYWAGMPLRGGRDRSTEPVADRAVTASDRRRMEDVMIKEDYWLTWAMAMLGPLIIWYHPCTYFLGATKRLLAAGRVEGDVRFLSSGSRSHFLSHP
jgi:hypothetical protein